MDRKQHWEHVYSAKESSEVSWFQADPTTSLRLLEAAGLNRSS